MSSGLCLLTHTHTPSAHTLLRSARLLCRFWRRRRFCDVRRGNPSICKTVSDLSEDKGWGVGGWRRCRRAGLRVIDESPFTTDLAFIKCRGCQVVNFWVNVREGKMTPELSFRRMKARGWGIIKLRKMRCCRVGNSFSFRRCYRRNGRTKWIILKFN